jgi:Putative peptidoglycan binding domain
VLNKLEQENILKKQKEKRMRVFFVVICSLALALTAVEAKKKEKKSHKSHAKNEHLVVSKGHGKGKKYKAQKFNLQTKARPGHIHGIKFEHNRRIAGSERWAGSHYYAFRNYRPVWHERSWWNSRYNRLVFAYGGWYYWNAGWWYPAWGYAPNSYYAYDGPIYAYNDLPPDQIVANVQAALQQQGYYRGDVDGLLGPLTRSAVATYQRDHGLYVTSAIDQPTLESLGMS